MIPIGLVTGFLGSGKTTLLRRVIERHRDRRIVYLVNEFGSVDIDGKVLALPPDRLVTIPGGSIFCRCLAGEFVHVLQQVARALNGAAPEGVVVEASGMADPKVARQMLQETRLDVTYTLRQVVAVVDPGNFLKLLHTLPNITAQIEACTIALVNKADLYREDEIAAAEAHIRRINPQAGIRRTQYARTDIDLFAPTLDRTLHGQYAACADPNYLTRTLAFAAPVDPDRLIAALAALHSVLYRAKGFVPTPAGTLYVDLSSASLTTTPAAGTTGHHLALIGRPASDRAIDDFLRAMAGAACLEGE